MSKQTKRARIPLKELPFMNSALSKLFNCGFLEIPDRGNEPNRILSESTNKEQPVNIHAIRLDCVLSLLSASQYQVTETVCFMQ